VQVSSENYSITHDNPYWTCNYGHFWEVFTLSMKLVYCIFNSKLQSFHMLEWMISQQRQDSFHSQNSAIILVISGQSLLESGWTGDSGHFSNLTGLWPNND
jgi:hypothetical protein